MSVDSLCLTEVGADSSATGTTVINHKTWGVTTIVSCGPTALPVQTAGILAVDISGTIPWSIMDSLTNETYQLADLAVDASGNIFIVYNPGRYNGVMILRPTNGGFSILVGSCGL